MNNIDKDIDWLKYKAEECKNKIFIEKSELFNLVSEYLYKAYKRGQVSVTAGDLTDYRKECKCGIGSGNSRIAYACRHCGGVRGLD